MNSSAILGSTHQLQWLWRRVRVKSDDRWPEIKDPAWETGIETEIRVYLADLIICVLSINLDPAGGFDRIRD